MFRNYVHLTGVISHCTLWATSPANDTYLENKHFNPDTAPEHKTSIYCVHGTADRSNSFSVIANQLMGKLPDNIDRIYFLTFDDRFQGTSVEDYARQLKNKIILNHSNNVILMGHSRGGLVCSWFAEYLSVKNDINVDLVVSVCGPFRGSYLAIWPLTKVSTSVDEMQVDGKLLHELSEKIGESSIRYLFLGAERDQLVKGDSYMPYQFERHGISVMKLPVHGHLSMMSTPDPLLIDALTDVITSVKREVQEDVQDNVQDCVVIKSKEC